MKNRCESPSLIREASPFRIRAYDWRGAESISEHLHPEPRVVVALDGGFREVREGREADYGPGAILIRPQGELHSDHYGSDGGSYVRFAVDDEVIARTLAASKRSSIVSEHAHLLGHRLAFELRARDRWSELSTVGLCYEILAIVGRRCASLENSRPAWVDLVITILHEDYSEVWTLARLAELVGVEPERLSRTFRAHTGHRVGDELRLARVEAARRAIASSNATLAEVAASTGFADQSHLSRSFQRVLGSKPSAHRRS